MGLFDFLCEKPKLSGPFSGGTGATMDDAVVITAQSTFMGICAEYSYVQQQCGRKDKDWTIEWQALQSGPGGKLYDLLTIKLKDRTIRDFYFDISSFYGKF